MTTVDDPMSLDDALRIIRNVAEHNTREIPSQADIAKEERYFAHQLELLAMHVIKAVTTGAPEDIRTAYTCAQLSLEAISKIKGTTWLSDMERHLSMLHESMKIVFNRLSTDHEIDRFAWDEARKAVDAMRAMRETRVDLLAGDVSVTEDLK